MPASSCHPGLYVLTVILAALPAWLCVKDALQGVYVDTGPGAAVCAALGFTCGAVWMAVRRGARRGLPASVWWRELVALAVLVVLVGGIIVFWMEATQLIRNSAPVFLVSDPWNNIHLLMLRSTAIVTLVLQLAAASVVAICYAAPPRRLKGWFLSLIVLAMIATSASGLATASGGVLLGRSILAALPLVALACVLYWLLTRTLLSRALDPTRIHVGLLFSLACPGLLVFLRVFGWTRPLDYGLLLVLTMSLIGVVALDGALRAAREHPPAAPRLAAWAVALLDGAILAALTAFGVVLALRLEDERIDAMARALLGG